MKNEPNILAVYSVVCGLVVSCRWTVPTDTESMQCILLYSKVKVDHGKCFDWLEIAVCTIPAALRCKL